MCARDSPRLLLVGLGAWLGLAEMGVTGAAEHPSLLLSPGDRPRLRHVCGVAGAGEPHPGCGKLGRYAADYQALRLHFAARPADEPLPGEVLAAAFLHVVDPDDEGDAQRLELVSVALRAAPTLTLEPLELALAADWCWPDLPAAVRQEFLRGLREWGQPLSAGDSPLEPRTFGPRLAALAAAQALGPLEEAGPSWAALRERLCDAGRGYFRVTWPEFVAARGLSPTGPTAAAREERDAALAIEVGGALLGQELWPSYRGSVGRWLEHYIAAETDHAALRYGFLRDDGGAAPLTPAPTWQELFPVTAHLIAVRTGDPAAVLLARRVEAAMRASDQLTATVWRWVPIVFDLATLASCDPQRLPPARNLGGAVVFRGGTGPETMTVWIDAAQPFLRRRQHFDAGHFLVRCGRQLVVDGGDDVTFEAVASKGGQQHLGARREPFDFEQYSTATIAHNCLVFWNSALARQWYGRRYLPVGGQRCIEDTCTDFALPPAAQGRATGRQLAYGHTGAAGYLALDLTPAYDPQSVGRYVRAFVFLLGRVLVVADWVRPADDQTLPTWILNLPAAPRADGQPLPEEVRVAGRAGAGGVWRCDEAAWLCWTEGDGAAWWAAPLPDPRRLRVVGGPATRCTVQEGRHAGRTYVGGEAGGFERLIIPAERHGALNAWYRLGAPTLLGTDFGRTPHWGRIEIEPAERAAAYTFVTVLVCDRATAEQRPQVACETTADELVVQLEVDLGRATVRLGKDGAAGGTIEVRGPQPLRWTLPTDVVADAPLPTRPD